MIGQVLRNTVEITDLGQLNIYAYFIYLFILYVKYIYKNIYMSYIYKIWVLPHHTQKLSSKGTEGVEWQNIKLREF